jgi:O-antigen/teichoic acid export membrane protein
MPSHDPGPRIGRFWSDNAALGAATVITGLLNTAYSLLLAHSLGPGDYGQIGALNNVVSLFLLPLPVVGLVAIRVGRRASAPQLSLGMVGLGLGVFGLAAAMSGRLGRAFHMAPILVTLYAASVIFNFSYALYIGFLERARRYRTVGAVLVLASVLGVASALLAVTGGRHHPVTWLGIFQAVAVLLLWLFVKRLAWDVPAAPVKPLERQVLVTTLGIGTLQSLWGLTDTLVAKAELSIHGAGLYTGLSTIGQGLPYLVSSLATVMLTASLDDPHHRAHYLGRTLLATGALATAYLGALAFFPQMVVRLTLGPQFLPLRSLLLRYGVAMAALSVTEVLTTYGVAVGAYEVMIAGAVGTGGWFILLLRAHAMHQLVNRTVLAMSGTTILVIMALVVSRRFHKGSSSATGYPGKW